MWNPLDKSAKYMLGSRTKFGELTFQEEQLIRIIKCLSLAFWGEWSILVCFRGAPTICLFCNI